MATWPMVSATLSSTAGVGPNTTLYVPLIGGTSAGVATESNAQTLLHGATTLSNLWVRVTANGQTGTTTIRIRLNGVDGGQSVSISAGATGTFEDTTGTDTIADGDLACYSLTTVASGTTVVIPILSCLCTNGSITPTLGNWSIAAVGSSATLYMPLVGQYNGSATTESQVQYSARVAMTITNLRIYVTSGNTSTNTIRIRKNGADGNGAVSFTGNTGGSFEDVTGSDSVAVGDLVCYAGINASTMTSMSISVVQCLVATAEVPLIVASQFASTQGFGTTTYWPVEGVASGTAPATEANEQMKARDAPTVKNLMVRIISNIVNGTTTIDLRKGGASTALTVSIGASATGVFTDVTHTVALVAGDLINYRVSTAGSSGAIQVGIISITWPPPASATNFPRSVSLSVASSLSVARLTVYGRAPSLSVVNAITVIRRLAPIRALSISVASSLSVVRVTPPLSRALSITVAATLSVARALTQARSSSLSVASSLALSRIQTLTRALSVSVASSLVVGRGFGVALSLSVASALSVTRLFTIGRPRSLSVAPSLSVARVQVLARALTLSAVPSLTLTRAFTARRTLSLSIASLLSVVKIKPVNRSLGLSVASVLSVARLAIRSRSLTLSIASALSTSRQVSTVRTATISVASVLSVIQHVPAILHIGRTWGLAFRDTVATFGLSKRQTRPDGTGRRATRPFGVSRPRE